MGFCTRADVVLPDVTTALATSATCLPDADLRIYHLEIQSRASVNSEPRLPDVEHNQPDLEVFAHGTTRNVLTVTQTGARATT